MTRVDTSASRYSESPTAGAEFSREELRHCKTLLRRLQFLESKVNESGGITHSGGSGGAAWAEWESAALEWALTDNGYLITSEPQADQKFPETNQRKRKRNS